MRVASLLFIASFGLPRLAPGQTIDARLIPPGMLRVSFAPEYSSWDRVFAEDGSTRTLGTYFSGDAGGTNLFPTLAGAESAVRTIIGDPSFRLSLGGVTTTIDADVRRFPLEFALGLAKRLSFTANIPIVVTRVNAAFAIDSNTANAGWNQATVESQNATGRTSILLLLTTLESAAGILESGIAAGSYGCPSSVQCDQARSLVTRSRDLRTGLVALSGVTATGPVPPLAPLAGSAAGLALRAAIDSLGAELSGFGVATISGNGMPLPTTRLGAADFRSILSGTAFGFGATIPAYSKRPNFGDIELGARLGLIQHARARVTLVGTARLPTGVRDNLDNLVDIGTGDRQLDVVGGVELAVEPGPVSFTASASYTLQMPNSFVRRVTTPDQPIALASTATLARRDLGDVIWLTAYPAIRLAGGFRLYGSASYYRKGVDRFAPAPGATGPAPEPLERQTAIRWLSVGGGIGYRVPVDGASPFEAGTSFQTAVSGAGGVAPRATVFSMYLRWFYQLW